MKNIAWKSKYIIYIYIYIYIALDELNKIFYKKIKSPKTVIILISFVN